MDLWDILFDDESVRPFIRTSLGTFRKIAFNYHIYIVMPVKNNCCDDVVVEAIQAAIPGFHHSCASRSSRHKAKPVPLTVINEYCTAVNGTITTLSGDRRREYTICYLMKKLFNKIPQNNSTTAPGGIPDPGGGAAADPPGGGGVGVAAVADPPSGGGVTAAGNKNTNTADPPVVGATIRDPPGGIMLPGTTTGAATVPKQEAAAAEIAVGNDRIMIHEYNNRTNSIGLASSLLCPIPPGGVITNTSANASSTHNNTTNNMSAASVGEYKYYE